MGQPQPTAGYGANDRSRVSSPTIRVGTYTAAKASHSSSASRASKKASRHDTHVSPRYSQNPKQALHARRAYREKMNKVRQNSYHQLCLGCVAGLLLLGCLLSGRVVVTNLMRLPVLWSHLQTVQTYHEETQVHYQTLQEEIAHYSAPQGIEALARNNLDKVAPGEILVRVHVQEPVAESVSSTVTPQP